MLINLKLQELANRQIPIPWSTKDELLDKDADCWLYQIPQREECPLSELLITPISSDLWPFTWEVTMTVCERKGIMARLASFMGERHINILLANSITVDHSRSHVIRVLIDCSEYKSQRDGESSDRRDKPNAKLKGLQQNLAVEFIEEICFLRPKHPNLFINRNTTLWHAFQEKEKRPSRPQKKLSISEGAVKLPRVVMERIEKSYSKNYGIAPEKLGAPFGLISFDEYSDLVRVFVLYQGLGMIPVIIKLPNLPDSIARVTHLLQKHGFNILASRAWTSHDQYCTTAWLLLKDDLIVESYPIENQKIREKIETILPDESEVRFPE